MVWLQELLLKATTSTGRVIFNGERDGLREDIDVRYFDGAPVIDVYADIIESFPGKLSSYAGRSLNWTDVQRE